MKFDSLAGWLSWIEQSHIYEIDLGLGRISEVAFRLNLLSPEALVVTVAGTNGKGSCVAASALILQSAGYSVGVYTSPHILHYNERICVNGQTVTDDAICEAFEVIFQASQASDTHQSISLTYFEYGTLAALYLFKKHQVTAIVLEVGLGGRLDAVNVVDADIAIITSIDLDHQEWLGDTREKIASEKAGILRSNRPFICSEIDPPQSLIDYAVSLNTEMYFLGADFFYQTQLNAWCWWNHQHIHGTWQALPHLPLPSIAAALQLASILQLDFVALNLFDQLANLRIPGRFQEIQACNRHWILDVAHNPAATAMFSRRLIFWKTRNPKAKVHAIVGMMFDKDRVGSLGNLTSLVNFWYLVDLSFLSRAATIDQLTDNLKALDLMVTASGKFVDCLNSVVENSQPEDVILVFGSFYTVAEAIKVLSKMENASA